MQNNNQLAGSNKIEEASAVTGNAPSGPAYSLDLRLKLLKRRNYAVAGTLLFTAMIFLALTIVRLGPAVFAREL